VLQVSGELPRLSRSHTSLDSMFSAQKQSQHRFAPLMLFSFSRKHMYMLRASSYDSNFAVAETLH
jgi:hypothetical protein